jgi:hypothetical protein
MKIRILICFIAVVNLAKTTELLLQDGNHIVFNTSMGRDTISLTFSSYGKINTSIFLESKLFS